MQDQIAQLRELSSIEYDASLAYEGEDYILDHGMDTILKHLAQGVDIRTQTVVERIDYTEADVILVRTRDGQVFEAKSVICTVPLGVLQKGVVFGLGLDECLVVQSQIVLGWVQLSTVAPCTYLCHCMPILFS